MRLSNIVAVSLLLGGCAEASRALDYPSDRTWQVSSGLDATVTCVVEKMRDGYRAHSLAFVAGIVVPNSVYEVRPDRPLMLGGDPLVVRVSKVNDTQTRVELFGIGVFKHEPVPYLEQCT